MSSVNAKVPVTFDKIQKSFGAVRVLEELNLAIEPGEFLVLLGALAWWLGASAAPLLISSVASALLVLSILAAWRLAGRDIIALSELLLTAPAYALRKLPMYAAFLWKRQSTWVRAKREGD